MVGEDDVVGGRGWRRGREETRCAAAQLFRSDAEFKGPAAESPRRSSAFKKRGGGIKVAQVTVPLLNHDIRRQTSSPSKKKKKKKPDYTRYSLPPLTETKAALRYLDIRASASASFFSIIPPSATSASTLATCAQTVTSVLLLVGSPLCLGCMCGEWP